jgi:hypothetical protein
MTTWVWRRLRGGVILHAWASDDLTRAARSWQLQSWSPEYRALESLMSACRAFPVTRASVPEASGRRHCRYCETAIRHWPMPADLPGSEVANDPASIYGDIAPVGPDVDGEKEGV